MKNITLLLVLISGLLAGYLIGDYRGKEARAALDQAVRTGKSLDTEREASIARLKAELDGIDEKHHQELAALQQDNEARAAAWRHSRDKLNDQLKRATGKLAESDTQLKTLSTQRDAASGDEKAKLELDIQHLKQEQTKLRREIESNACLQAQVPQSVFDALQLANAGENRR